MKSIAEIIAAVGIVWGAPWLLFGLWVLMGGN